MIYTLIVPRQNGHLSMMLLYFIINGTECKVKSETVISNVFFFYIFHTQKNSLKNIYFLVPLSAVIIRIVLYTLYII